MIESAVIIGAGPAGASAALLLARAGVRVTIVEAKAFPRVKVCGEFISPAATHLLEGLVAREELEAIGARRAETFVLEVGRREYAWKLPRPAWAVSRHALDAMLLDRARAAGAEVVQPAKAERVELADDGARLVLRDGREFAGDVLIHADGLGRLDPAGAVRMRSGLVGCKCHVRDESRRIAGVRIRSCAGAYVGTMGVEGGLATCALVIRGALLKHAGGDIDEAVSRVMPSFADLERVTKWQSCGVIDGPAGGTAHPRSLRIGAAGGTVDPIGGEGIALSLWSAHAMVDVLNGPIASARPRLERAFAARLRLRRPACRLAAAMLMRPRIVKGLHPALAMKSLSIGPWYALTKGRLDVPTGATAESGA